MLTDPDAFRQAVSQLYHTPGLEPHKDPIKHSYASVVETTIPPTPDESRDITIDDYRGSRQLHNIQIDSYHSESFLLDNILSHTRVDTTSMSTGPPGPINGDRETATSTVDESHKKHVTGKQKADRQERRLSRESPDVENPHDGAKQKEVRFQPISKDEPGHGMERPPIVRPKSQSPTPRGTQMLHFYSGNPSIEKVKGILHIYKDNLLTNLNEDTPRSELVCMLAVPAKFTIHDLLLFNGPCLEGIEYMRVVRDASPNQYMVLVKFRNQKLADEYYKTYNNTTYNSLEADICHLVYVGRLEMLRESENACSPVLGMTELPNCPVCLERMDESVDGILTILCNHAFHMGCLDKWGDTSCPVCRYVQTPEEVADNRCMKCGSQESLWICLICGNIGCGRYVGLHAYRHFQETHHTYAMELGNNKVWDYVGDNYVHRLVQNKSDGKLVQVDERGYPVQDEKLDALNLEYTYLLTNQLESQRLYFEEKIEDIETVSVEKIHLVEGDNEMLSENCCKLEAKLEHSNKDKVSGDKKITHLHTRLKKALHDLQEEKEMNKSLLQNQAVWQTKVTSLEAHIKEFTESSNKEMQELREQLRDVMFYMDAQQKLASTTDISQEEIQDGQVVVGAAAPSPATRRARKKPR